MLLDQLGRPLRDLRISVTDRCNLRCTYCMPAEVFGPDYAFLPRSEVLSFEEIERLSRAFVDLGVRKLRITGGEPTLRRDLPELIGRLTAIPGVEDVALTTNGLLLPRLFLTFLTRLSLKRIQHIFEILSYVINFWFNTEHIFYLTILRAGSLKQASLHYIHHVGKAELILEVLGENCFLTFSSF